MRKEKFHIPIPNEDKIETEIKQIVALGAKRKESFFPYIKSMIQQVGIRQLFSDRTELIYIFIIAITSLSIFLIQPDPEMGHVQDLYAYLFLVSPLLFLVFSIYTYANKVRSTTYEVEMTCKYNVYQIIACRMLAFSIIAILMNTMTIFFFAMFYEDVQFMRAFMISTSGLFIFSILFIYAMMKRRAPFTVGLVISGWLVGNILLRGVNNALYSEMLVHMPLFVYALVLASSLLVYLHNLKKLIQIKQMEGVF